MFCVLFVFYLCVCVSQNIVGAASLSQHPKRFIMLRTPKVPRQQAIKAVIASLKAHQTRMANWKSRKMLYMTKNPMAKTYHRRSPRFHPKFKRKIAWSTDSISVEKNSLSGSQTCDGMLFHLFRTHRSVLLSRHMHTHQPTNSQRELWTHRYPTRNLRLASPEGMNWINSLDKDFKVHLSLGRWFLLLPQVVNVADRISVFKPPQLHAGLRWVGETRQSLDDADEITALDPGVRKPFVCYSPQGRVDVIGTNVKKVAIKSFRRVDRRKSAFHHAKDAFGVFKSEQLLQKKEWLQHDHSLRECQTQQHNWRKEKRRQAQQLARAHKRYRLAELKQRYIAKNFHYNVSHFLLRRYKTIILPTTSSHQWRRGKHLHKTTKRMIQFLALGSFAMRLKQTASFYPGRKILRCSEAYTSKQCGACGHINDKLGGSEVFRCAKCGEKGDRDVHAARNIALRVLQI